MNVLLNGGVARRGMNILSQHFGDRISLRQFDNDDNSEAMAKA